MSAKRLSRNHNIAKRKLDKCDDDLNQNKYNKKRKITRHQKVSNRLNVLIESNISLTRNNQKLNKQNEYYKIQSNNYKKRMNHYKEGVNIYKQESDKWKSEYLKLKSQLNVLVSNTINTNDTECARDIEILYPTVDTTEIIYPNVNTTNNQANTNKNSDDEDESQYNLRSIDKSQNTDNRSETYEDSYYIHANCHICDKQFDEIEEYAEHIKQHYDNDPLKKWLQCDFGCKNRTFNHYTMFIPHIASHTKDYPYRCLLKMNGANCDHVASTKYQMKRHWEYHKKLVNKELIRKNDSSESYYTFQMDCHVCHKQFDNYSIYRRHITNHYYDEISSKTWLQCDLGCNKSYTLSTEFIAHIAKHLKQRPFQCKECNTSSLRKTAMDKHWTAKHSKNKPKSKKKMLSS